MAGDWAQCVDDSVELRDATPDPTRHPTRPPTRPPTRRPVEVDEDEDEPEDGGGGTATVIEGTVFYPDVDLGACRFDGKHQNSPYQFATAELCCHNRLMDYDRCMAYADPYGIGGSGPAPSPSGGGAPSPTYDGGEDSVGEDEDETIPPVTCRWYPNPLNFGSCMYSPHYPPSWSTSAMFLYDTHIECCIGAFLQWDGCGEELACGDDATGASSGGGDGGGGSAPSGSASIVPTTL